jgi:hypothetical protein
MRPRHFATGNTTLQRPICSMPASSFNETAASPRTTTELAFPARKTSYGFNEAVPRRHGYREVLTAIEIAVKLLQ